MEKQKIKKTQNALFKNSWEKGKQIHKGINQTG
jgi:hypothetical protein